MLGYYKFRGMINRYTKKRFCSRMKINRIFYAKYSHTCRMQIQLQRRNLNNTSVPAAREHGDPIRICYHGVFNQYYIIIITVQSLVIV